MPHTCIYITISHRNADISCCGFLALTSFEYMHNLFMLHFHRCDGYPMCIQVCPIPAGHARLFRPGLSLYFFPWFLHLRLGHQSTSFRGLLCCLARSSVPRAYSSSSNLEPVSETPFVIPFGSPLFPPTWIRSSSDLGTCLPCQGSRLRCMYFRPHVFSTSASILMVSASRVSVMSSKVRTSTSRCLSSISRLSSTSS